MATIGQLVIDIVGNIDPLKKSIKSGLGSVKEAGGKFSAFGNTVLKGALGVGAGLAAGGILALGTALVGVGATSVDMASQINQSQNDIVAGLGATREEAERLGDVATRVFANNFAGSIAEATDVIIEARRQLGDLADNELQAAAENALRLSDTFGVDYAESLNAANALMTDFGLTQAEAFDFLAQGFQKGLNNSDDFVDSIGEYSTLFADTGFSAAEMFSIMESGAQAGVLGTDKIADSIKEMGLILNEGTDGAREALTSMGLDYDQLAASVAAGNTTWADSFPTILEGLQSIEDPIARNQAQVGLFGTMAEDLGVNFTNGLSTATTSLEDMSGATDALNAKYQNFGSMFEGLKRQALVALVPIGEKLLELANKFMPQVEAIFARVSAALPVMIAAIMPAIDTAINWITGTAVPALVKFGAWFMSTGLPAVIAFVRPIVAALIPGLKLIASVALQLGQTVLPVFSAAWALITNNMNIVRPIMIAIGVAVLALSSPISLILAAVVGLATAWANNFGGIQTKTMAFLAWIRPIWQATWGAISAVFQATWGIIQSIWGAFRAAFQGDWRSFGENLRAVWDQAWRLIGNVLQNAGQILLNLALNAMMNIVTTILNIDWWSVGMSIIQGIGNGILAGIGFVRDAARSAAQAALDAAKGFLGISSPSSVFEQQIGGNMVAGLTNALQAGASQVSAATQGLLALPDQAIAGAAPGGGAALAGGGGAINIEQIIIQANDEAGGRRAGEGFVDALRDRGLMVGV